MPTTQNKNPLIEMKGRIVGKAEAGMTQMAIAVSLEKARLSVLGIIKRFSVRGTVQSAPKPGWPHSEPDLCQLEITHEENS